MIMEKEKILNVNIEYGKENLKQIIIKLLKQHYIEYISINEN